MEPTMTARISVSALALLAASAAQASVPVEMRDLACLAHKENAAVVVELPDQPKVAEARLYFRREIHGDYYWTAFHPDQGDGQGQDASKKQTAWAIFPKPDNENKTIEFYVDLLGEDGKSIAVSAQKLAPVKDDCDVDLTGEQRREGNKLTVGETTPDQRDKAVAWFICDGVTERIDVDGKRRPDNYCGITPSPFPVQGQSDHGIVINPKPRPPVSPSRPGGGR
jgi:hypothetical protein